MRTSSLPLEAAFRRLLPPVLRAVPGLVVALLAWPAALSAQAASVGSGCDVPSFTKLTNVALSNGSRITYLSDPLIVCPGDTRITADSAVVYEATNYTQFFRNVVFEDADSRLTASQAHYFDQERRLRAWGDVIITDHTEGSVLRGDTVVMLRAGPGRLEDQLTLLGRRPSATLYPTRQPIPEAPIGDAPELEETEAALERPGTSVPDSGGVVEPDTLGAVTLDSAAVETPDPLPSALPDSAAVAELDSLEVLSPDSAAVVDPAGEDPEGPDLPPRVEATETPVTPEERIPYEIEARRIFMEGTRYLRAEGSVTIRRDSVNAAADSVEYDEALGALFLSQNSELVTSNFDLSARRIRLDIPQDEIKEVLAEENSVLEGDDLLLLAPTIRLFMTEGRLERLVALRDSVLDELPQEMLDARSPHPAGESIGLVQFPIRPHAFAQDFLLWADSIEVLAPQEVLEEVWAMGNARGESMAEDTLTTEDTPEIARRDWLAGDTVIAVFASDTVDSGIVEGADLEMEIAPPPSAGRVQGEDAPSDSSGYHLDRLIARVGARSLYRMAATDSTVTEEEVQRMAIHYVVGEEITIHMSEGGVDHMEVSGATQGIHLEPIGPGGAGVPGERGTPPPTPPQTRPDTSAVLPGRGGGRP
jgi:lipopolysaccharide export system protein LptA